MCQVKKLKTSKERKFWKFRFVHVDQFDHPEVTGLRGRTPSACVGRHFVTEADDSHDTSMLLTASKDGTKDCTGSHEIF